MMMAFALKYEYNLFAWGANKIDECDKKYNTFLATS